MFDKKIKNKGLKIIIVGCGKVGTILTKRLVQENHDITIIDKDANMVQNLTNLYDVYGIVGNGASFTTLSEANVEQADLLIAVTGSDELNLLCCVVAKQSSRCDVIARVRTPEYSAESAYLKTRLDLAMIINPELQAAREITRILYLPTAIGVTSFARGQAEMVRIKVPKGSMLNGKRLMDLRHELSGAVLICAAERDGEVCIPSGSFQIAEGDVLSFLSPARDAKTFLKKIGLATHQVKNTLIIGGGKIAYYLAKKLSSVGIDVTIIEINKENCEMLAGILPKAVIINADGTDTDVLKEANIDQFDSVVSLTGMDEENILLSLYVKEVSNAKVVTKISQIRYHQVIDHLDLGSIINPKLITLDLITAFVRAKTASKDCSDIETMLHLFNNRVEAIEFKVGKDAKVIDTPICNLPLKSDLLIACISRDGRILIPNGDDSIQAGDSVIIVTTHTGLHDIHDILR